MITTVPLTVERLCQAVLDLQKRVKSLEDTRDRLIKVNTEIANGKW